MIKNLKPKASAYAAIDIGSNSFHLLIVHRLPDGTLRVVDRLKETVQLASGLDKQNRLSKSIMERGIATLTRFQQRIKNIPLQQIQAVATNTLRVARNRATFIRQGSRLLGVPIEVISGCEEARLIYIGVAHGTHIGESERLVVDIGGGSTELVIGRGFDPLWMESLSMGCINMSQRFFSGGTISSGNMEKAIACAQAEFATVHTSFRKHSWSSALGSSGTILAVSNLIREQRLGTCINTSTLQALIRLCVEAGHAKKLAEFGVPAERRHVLLGGAAILSAVFSELSVEKMTLADGALREGVIQDLLSRTRQEDAREKTVQSMMRRYAIDEAHATRVENTALGLLQQIGSTWKISDAKFARLLSWASRLHEVGIALSHVRYHKHGEYILRHSDMAGFSLADQVRLALLVAFHRRKLPKPPYDEDDLEQLPSSERDSLFRLVLPLRLAVLLNRDRSAVPLPHAAANSSSISLKFDQGWLGQHPLTLADLKQEKKHLKALGLTLRFAVSST